MKLLPLLSIVAFFSIWITVHFVSKMILRNQLNNKDKVPLPENEPQGSLRGVYQIFFLLILWSLLVFFVPLLFTYKQILATASNKMEIVSIFLKAAYLPALFILLILYGQSRGFLRWIHEADWPKDDI